jgi:4-hydroxy-tetrahydrodipicolinate synthase
MASLTADRLDGVHVPVVTPFDSSDTVDRAALGRVVEFVVGAGVRGVVATGTTGEYYALDASERETVMAVVADTARGAALLTAGCNAGSTREAIRLGTCAARLGYDALMLAAPPTSLPNQRELAAHFLAVADAVGLPVVLYDFPARAGVQIDIECLDLIAAHPAMVAIKESSGDLSRVLQLLGRYDGSLTVICGADDHAADHLFWGVRSWLAGTANVLPAEHVAVVDAANRGDLPRARALFAEILPWIQWMESGGYNAKVKAGLSRRGIDVGTVRPPLLPLPADELAEMEAFAALFR